MNLPLFLGRVRACLYIETVYSLYIPTETPTGENTRRYSVRLLFVYCRHTNKYTFRRTLLGKPPCRHHSSLKHSALRLHTG